MDREDRDERPGPGHLEEARPPDELRIPDGAPPGGDDDGDWTGLRVYKKCGPFVYRTLQQLGVRFHDLDDMLHEVFVVVHLRLASYDRSRSIKAWLYGICENKVRNYRKSARWRREVLVQEIPEQGIDSAEPNAEQYLNLGENISEQRQILNELLDELDLDKRAILVMHYIDGMRYAEIAEALGIPVGTVGSRRSTALNALTRSYARHKARLSMGEQK